MSTGQAPQPDPSAAAPPGIRVVRGNPTPEETAALVTVLAAASAATAESSDDRRSRPPSLWNDRSRIGRSLHRVGPGAWRGTALRG